MREEYQPAVYRCDENWRWSGTRFVQLPVEETLINGPVLGEPFSTELPWLRLHSFEAEEYGGWDRTTGQPRYVRYRFHYSSDVPDPAESGIRERVELRTETLTLGEGRTWTATGRKCDVPITATLSYMLWTVQFFSTDQAYSPGRLLEALNVVNDAEWRGWAAGTVLLDDASVEPSRDGRGQVQYYVSLTFRIRKSADGLTWNHLPRAPEYQRAWDGTLLYDTNHQLVPVSGAAGEAGWDTTSPPLYESADFSTLFPGL